MTEYYKPDKLLNMKDLNGNTPAIFIADGNRSSGKTTAFNKLLLDEFLTNGKKFCILNRYKYELDDVANKFFNVIGNLFFPGYTMTETTGAGGLYKYLWLQNTEDPNTDPVNCGYAISLNSSDKLKKAGNVLCDVETIVFDEFQLESGEYCSNEVKKFQSLYYTIARGGGSQSRYVRVILIGNSTSLINPYYIAFGVTDRLRDDTKFLRGTGWVLEHNYNEGSAKAISGSAFASAFENSGSNYTEYATNNKYLKDSNAFIEKPKGAGRYLFTLKCGGHEYGVLEYTADGFIYVSDKADTTNPNRIAVDLEDHTTNYVLLSRYDSYISRLRYLFERSSIRFKNQRCKSAFLKMLNYHTE